MAGFYKEQRIRHKILVSEDNKPIGGKWSFDSENRKKFLRILNLPPKFIFKETEHTVTIKKKVEEHFSNNPGNVEDFWISTTRKGGYKFF